MTFLPPWLRVWHLYSKFLKCLQIKSLTTEYTVNWSWPHCIWSIKTSWNGYIHSVSSVAQSCPTLYDPMYCSMPGFPVYHQLPEFTQIHVHWVSDAIPSHPLLSPSPPAFNLSQHPGVSSLHQVAIGASASVLPMNILEWFPLGLIGLISLQVMVWL